MCLDILLAIVNVQLCHPGKQRNTSLTESPTQCRNAVLFFTMERKQIPKGHVFSTARSTISEDTLVTKSADIGTGAKGRSAERLQQHQV